MHMDSQDCCAAICSILAATLLLCRPPRQHAWPSWSSPSGWAARAEHLLHVQRLDSRPVGLPPPLRTLVISCGSHVCHTPACRMAHSLLQPYDMARAACLQRHPTTASSGDLIDQNNTNHAAQGEAGVVVPDSGCLIWRGQRFICETQRRHLSRRHLRDYSFNELSRRAGRGGGGGAGRRLPEAGAAAAAQAQRAAHCGRGADGLRTHRQDARLRARPGEPLLSAATMIMTSCRHLW